MHFYLYIWLLIVAALIIKNTMKELLKRFENKPPQIVFEWHDSETEAEGWIVINSLRGGAAGGGTRMRKGLNKREVESLAKTMEIKFSVCGPPIGGAKSGINFDPKDPRKQGVLERWYKAVTPLLKNYYGTGGDMNVDEIEDVIPITEKYGLWHPQEGIVNGHFNPTDSEKITKLGQLRMGVTKIIENEVYSPDLNRKYTVSDMITGYGVSESVKHYYNIYGSSLKGKRAIIQGWGNVGAAAGFFLAQQGVSIVGIIDAGGALINPKGYDFKTITKLFNGRQNKMLTDKDLISFEEGHEKIWHVPAEIFIPAAGSRLVNEQHFDHMVANGLEVISSGANVPFNDAEIFYGATLAKADQQVSVIPDFIANSGMARVFAFLMEGKKEFTAEEIFQDVSNTIKKALIKTYETNTSGKYITKAALDIALHQLLN